MMHLRLSLLLGAFLLCSVFAFVYMQQFFVPTVVIYDGETFTPNTITVKLGETIEFKNKSGEAFWPASDLHPSHMIYDAFDPEEPIAPGASWSFTFMQAGTWDYHNHVKSAHGGTVIVTTTEGTAVVPDCNLYENKIHCWKNDLTTLVSLHDLEGAFAYISAHEQEPLFMQNCHSITHLIGKEAYHIFSINPQIQITEKSTYCGYGFFHGFMEAMLSATGDLEDAVQFCDHVDRSLNDKRHFGRDACYHGIGHSTVDGSDPRTWNDAYATVQPGLTLCLQVAKDDNEQDQCGNGVFDGLVTAYRDGSFGFTSIPSNFYELCTRIENPNFKIGCYTQFNPLAAFFSNGDIQKALALVETIQEPEYKATALGKVVATFARTNMTEAEYEPIINACYTFTGELRNICITDFARRLIEYGTDDSYLRGMSFCKSEYLQEKERAICLASI